METSLRYGGDSKALRIHAKEKLPIDSQTHLQVHGELDTRIGAPSYLSVVMRHFYPDLSASLGVGLQYDRHEKLRYSVRGKKAFPVTPDGLLSFNIKGRCDVDKELRERKSSGAAEFSWSIFNFQKGQDLRVKVGYEVVDKIPYLQIRENNWTLNTDINGRWSVRILGGVNSSATTESSQIDNVDSDFVVILAALLCALICVLGLVAVARCAWIRRISGRVTGRSAPPPPANKGLKKKTLRLLPKLTYSVEHAAKFSDCAICLAEFVAGDEIRVLPQCGHGFHVGCIDTWLGSHSSCPSCRQLLVVSRCEKCGGLPASSAAGAETEARLKQREDDINRFLP
ncbi:hypothetical protein F0562_026932 [Nyssa sinensis]|uniref:RING-type domain-containing protein n=1 Tax=Nyssa sinensis TaxID=561372 RepID=A0A5J5B885_9ASTE|nr:hypothetical protein F0562_026932 [Nyssa sinensis]